MGKSTLELYVFPSMDYVFSLLECLPVNCWFISINFLEDWWWSIFCRLTWLVCTIKITMLLQDLEIILLFQFSETNGRKTWVLKMVLGYWRSACVSSYIVIVLLSTSFRFVYIFYLNNCGFLAIYRILYYFWITNKLLLVTWVISLKISTKIISNFWISDCKNHWRWCDNLPTLLAEDLLGILRI